MTQKRISRFEDLPVWRSSARLFVDVVALTRQGRVSECGDLVNQVRRATLSISNNIAEGFERGSTAELISFLYIARGSAGETRSMLTILQGVEHLHDLKPEISDLRSDCESISRQLGGWLKSLKNTEIKGTRYLNDTSRAQYEQRIRAERFIEKLEAARRGKTPGGE